MIKFEQALETVEGFFYRVDSGKLLQSKDPELFRNVRSNMIAALSSLLVWQRPRLESAKGIDWPYDRLRNAYPALRSWAEREEDDSRKKQAELFLAMLPFPNQWQWLLRAQQVHWREPELISFLAAERRSIWQKMGNKPQNSYKLRHFCQVLKKPQSNREKGVLRMFSLPYLFAIHSRLLDQVSDRYVLYVEPPMGIVFRHAWWRCFSVLRDPAVFGVSSQEDVKFLQQQAGVVPIPIAHGDYMEDILRQPDQPDRKDYDIVFNATYDDMERKRHGLMLRLLLDPLLHNATALFLGRGGKSNVTKFRRQVVDLGLQSRVTVMANLRRADVPEQLSRCRVGVHLSLYENGCRSIYEFFRADIPCVISSSMGGVNLTTFNAWTGKAVQEVHLAEAVASVLRHRQSFKPREWFTQFSGSSHSSRRLNGILQRLFCHWGYEWTKDIVQLGSSGASRYVHAADYHQFRNEFEWLLEVFNSLNDDLLTFTLE